MKLYILNRYNNIDRRAIQWKPRHAHHKPLFKYQTMFVEHLIWSIVPFLVIINAESDKVIYKFQEFPYKGNSKNEIAFREFESACEQSPDCISKEGTARIACVRRCISPSCHQDLYGHDPLEEGEIDVRLNSFKGCFIQRMNRPRQ